MGMIAATKRHYQRRYLNTRMSTMSVAATLRAKAKEFEMATGTAGFAEGHPAHVLNAVEMLQAAWNDITKDTVARCWIKLQTPLVMHQADFAQASGKSARHGSTDTGVAELTDVHNALSVDVKEATKGSGVLDPDLCEVLASLRITPGKLARKAAIDATQTWAGLEEQEKITQAIQLVAQDLLTERTNNTHVEKDNHSDDKLELEGVERAGTGTVGGARDYVWARRDAATTELETFTVLWPTGERRVV